jgi:hypothetical protein
VPLKARRTRPQAALFAALCVCPWAIGSARTARAEDLDGEPRFKSVAVQGNPLAFAIGRYSLDLEYLPVPHHALHATPYYEYALPGVDDQLTGFGAEVGYRYYTGEHGPHGFFAGASLLAAELEYIHVNPTGGVLDHANDTQYVQLGGAVDVGYQLVFLGNFAAGVGAGVQWTGDTLTPQFEYQVHPWHDLVYGPGVRPRILLQVGAAF